MHPFERWPERRRGRWLFALALVYAVVQIAIAAVNRPLSTDAAPDGIVTLELAGTREEASRIVDSWEREGALDEAGVSLGLDFLYMPLYAVLMAGVLVAVNRRAQWKIVSAVAWAPFIAAAFDVVETVSLVRVVDDPSVDGWAAVARAFALGKFALLIVTVLFILLVSAAGLIQRSPQEA
jgi:hypothetical protein